MAGRPLRPATDHRLGRPLPHQLANPTRTPSSMRLDGFPPPAIASAVVCGLNTHFWVVSPTQGQVSPRVPHPSATRSPKPPFDLHVLGTPPAFVLSQDQTLHQMLPAFPRKLSPLGEPSDEVYMCFLLRMAICTAVANSTFFTTLAEVFKAAFLLRLTACARLSRCRRRWGARFRISSAYGRCQYPGRFSFEFRPPHRAHGVIYLRPRAL